MIRAGIRTIVNRWPWLKAIRLILSDLWWGLRFQMGQPETESGATHEKLSDEDSVRYIEQVYSDYKRYGKLDRFYGTVAEIGPGDNLGVALLIRHDGCEQVNLIDRYRSRRDPQKQRRVYETLSNRYALDWLKSGPAWNDQEFKGLTLRIGQSAEAYFKQQARSRRQFYDIIVSRAVMEHLYDPLQALEDMVTCLKPGGRMLHKIDLRDHGMFTPYHQELTFLTFPGSLHRLMTRNSGRPNRVLWHQYRDLLDRLHKDGLVEYQAYITRLVGVGDLEPHQLFEEIPASLWRQATEAVDRSRKFFSHEFAKVDSRDLAVAGIFGVVTKQ